MKDLGALLGRILISIIFLMSCIGKIKDPVGTKAYMAANGMVAVDLFYIGAIVLLLAGAISLILGFYTRYGVILLIIFLIPTTLIFHTNFAQKIQAVQFMKNLAILGGLTYVLVNGAGSLSIDALMKKKR